MKSITRKLTQAMICIGLHQFGIQLFACSCAGTISGKHACNDAVLYDAVFTGKVAHIEHVFHFVAANAGHETLHVAFEDVEVFRGAVRTGREIDLETGSGGGDCGYHFVQGMSYIVYASRMKDGSLWTGICSLTRPVSMAQEDITYFRSLQTRPLKGWVLGTVWIRKASGEQSAEGAIGVRVVTTGTDGSTKETVISDGHGRFEIRDLVPGQYTITASKPDYSVVYQQPRKATVPAKGCATTDIILGPSPR